MPKNKAALILLFVVFAAACSKPAVNTGSQAAAAAASPEQRRIASADVVKVTPLEVVVPVGGSAEALVRLNIDHGYHVNANPPTYSYLKATELEIPAAEGVSVGFIVYPDAVKRKFPFAEQPLAIYEGEITIRVHLKAEKSVRPGARNLSGKLRVQACDDQVCYAPGMVDIAIPVSIK